MKKTYSEKLKDPRWQKKRLEILTRDEFTCRHCGDKEETLHVHHIKYNKGSEPWEYDDDNFLTLCESCHLVIGVTKANGHTTNVKSQLSDGRRQVFTFHESCSFTVTFIEEGRVIASEMIDDITFKNIIPHIKWFDEVFRIVDSSFSKTQ